MGKTQKDYEQEYRNEHTGEIEAKAAKRRQVAEEQKTGYNQLVDTATDQAAGKYRQSMDALPGQSQALYDQNAVTEAIGRKQIEERLSNMGHRNAGLSSSMQTALTVQKANADQQVRRQEQEQVTALQTAIDDLYAQSALTKAGYAAQVDDQTRSYEDTLWAGLEKNATDYAVGAYTADREYEAKVEEARLEAARKQEDGMKDMVLSLYKHNDNGDVTYAQGQAVQMGYTTGDKTSDATLLYYTEAIDNGYTPEEATLYANAGGGQTGLAAVEEYRVASTAQELQAAGVDTTSLTKFYAPSMMDFITSQKADMRAAIKAGRGEWTQDSWNASVQKAVDKATENLADTPLTDRTKQYATAMAVGETLKKVWAAREAADDGSGDTVDEATLMQRMYNALLTQFSGQALVVAAKAAGIAATT